MTKRKFQLSIVIPTLNGGSIFLELIDILNKQSMWNETELIIVDSGSIDKTVGAARNIGAKVIEIDPNEFNHGSSRDLGVSHASSEIVVLMVQDAIPNSIYFLQKILYSFENDNEIAGIYVRQIPREDADVITKRNLNNWLTGQVEKNIKSIKNISDYENLAAIEKYIFCNFDNVCSAIRKSIWENYKFGPVNFGEDIDWAERILKAGYKIIYEPDAPVIHSHNRSVFYEYKRTYVCHRKLYRQFKLHLVPSMNLGLTSLFRQTLNDIKYLLKHEKVNTKKYKLLIKIPILNLLSVIAQYRAVRDEVNSYKNNVSGI